MATVYLFPGTEFRHESALGGGVVAGVRHTGVAARPVAAAVRPAVGGRPVRPAPLRLTRRGRIVLRLAGAVVLALVVSAIVLAASRPAVAGIGSRPVLVRHHVVMPGETLMQIAADEVPGVDPRDTVARVIELNALAGSGVQAGQWIALPVDP